ncbi:MAG: hypothetical protein ABL986_09830 [Vicinamibacterales bacterium]
MLPRTLALFAALSLSVPTAFAQTPDWSGILVVTGALSLIDVPAGEGRALTLPRLIRVLHAVPFQEDSQPSGYAELQATLTQLAAFDVEVRRAPRGLSLAMAGTNTERDILQDICARLGVRLRERQKTFVLELKSGSDEAALRARLLRLGIDVPNLVTRVNRGETVQVAATTDTFPSPLSLQEWGRVLQQPVTETTLFGAIVLDRRAALLFLGLSAMSAETRQVLSRSPDLLRGLYEEAAPIMASTGGALRIDPGGRVIPPGGPDAVALWEALLDEKVTDTAGFVRALFTKNSGRLAYLYDTVEQLDPAKQRFALGLWLPADRRVERLRALADAYARVDPQWIVQDRPFARPNEDATTMLALAVVTPAGSPAEPMARKLWARAFEGRDIPAPAADLVRRADEEGSLDAAWLAEQVSVEEVPERAARLGQLAFGQRVFANAPSDTMEDVLVALRGVARYPSLLLTLERMGVRTPGVYARAIRVAQALEQIDDLDRAHVALAQFQGAVALLDGVARAQGWPQERAEELVIALASTPLVDGRFDGGVLDWIENNLLPALPAIDGPGGADLRLVVALAQDAPTVTRFQWEGTAYVTDVGATERRNVVEVRRRQGGTSLDTLLTLRTATRELARASTVEVVKRLTGTLRTIGGLLAPARTWAGGSTEALDVSRAVDRAVRDLGRITRPQDVSKALEAVVPLARVADALGAETLAAMAYIPALGDASSLIGPDADLSKRHAFGIPTARGTREPLAAWQRPRVGGAAAAGQALTGSLLGLDLGLVRRRLRRMAVDTIPAAPKLNSNYRDVFAQTLSLLGHRVLYDVQLREVAAAVTRGREMVSDVGLSAVDRAALARRVGMDGLRSSTLSWVAGREPARVPAMFSMAELYALGRRQDEAPQAYGVSQEPFLLCYCLALPATRQWASVTGRPGLGQLATAVPDVGLRVVELLAALDLPAALYPGVLSMALQEYVDTVPAAYDDDWLALTGRAAAITRERIEDYVSALVASGPVRLDQPIPGSVP